MKVVPETAPVTPPQSTVAPPLPGGNENRALFEFHQSLLGLEGKLGVGPHPGDGGVGERQFRHGRGGRGDLGFFLNLFADLGGSRPGAGVMLHDIFDRGDLGLLELHGGHGPRTQSNQKSRGCFPKIHMTLTSTAPPAKKFN